MESITNFPQHYIGYFIYHFKTPYYFSWRIRIADYWNFFEPVYLLEMAELKNWTDHLIL